MTDQEIASFMTDLQHEDEATESDRIRSFDGSETWRQLSERMAEEVRQNLSSAPKKDKTN